MIPIIKKLFNELEQFIEINEIAYLGIKNGELIPIYKNNTDSLSLNNWIEFHKQYRSFVKDSQFLIELVKTQKPALIKNTNELAKKPIEFQKLNINSIYLFPVIKNNEVVGIVDMAFRSYYYEFTDEQISKCLEVIDRYTPLL